jgi:DNA replication protein DnaC
MSTSSPQVLLQHHLKQLRLPTFYKEYEKLAQACAAEGVDHPRYLLRLSELELLDRERRTMERRIHAAKFPSVKSLDTFDFLAIPSLNKMLLMELARCEFITRRENVIALGNSGTGKTHTALALGLAACQRGHSVGFITAAQLVHQLMEAKDEKRLIKFQAHLANYKLLIIDELGGACTSESWCPIVTHRRGITLRRVQSALRTRQHLSYQQFALRGMDIGVWL